MKRIALFSMLLTLCLSASAQVKTMYNGQHKEVTKEKKAKFYRIVEQRNDKIYRVEYFQVNGPKLWDGLFYSIDPYKTLQKNTYFHSGKLKKSEQKGTDGSTTVTEYFENGQIMNRYSRNADGYFDGDIISFYEDGTPLRRDSYSAGQMLTGVCYDRFGKEVEHYPFFVDASFNGSDSGLSRAFRNLIYQNMNYPRIAKTYLITGVVYVGFTVKANCRIDDVEVVGEVYNEEDVKDEIRRAMREEAVRLIQVMNSFSKPAKINNQPTDMYYVTPVVFELK